MGGVLCDKVSGHTDSGTLHLMARTKGESPIMGLLGFVRNCDCWTVRPKTVRLLDSNGDVMERGRLLMVQQSDSFGPFLWDH